MTRWDFNTHFKDTTLTVAMREIMLRDLLLAAIFSSLFRCQSTKLTKNIWISIGCVHGARYFTNLPFIDLEATVGTYELRSYGGEQ